MEDENSAIHMKEKVELSLNYLSLLEYNKKQYYLFWMSKFIYIPKSVLFI